MSASKLTAAPVNDNSTTQPSSQSFTIPASAAVGAFCFFAMSQNTGVDTFTAPSGWATLAGPTTTGSNLTSQVWVKKLVAGDPGSSATFTSSGAGRMTAGYLVVQGGDLLTEIKVAVSTSASANPVITPTVDTTEADYYLGEIVVVRSALATAVTLAQGTGLTEDAECNTAFSTSPNFAMSISHATANTGAPNSYGGHTVTASQAITGAHAYTFAVSSAATAPPSGEDTGLRVKIVKEDGTVISVYVYAVQADGSLALVSSPA